MYLKNNFLNKPHLLHYRKEAVMGKKMMLQLRYHRRTEAGTRTPTTQRSLSRRALTDNEVSCTIVGRSQNPILYRRRKTWELWLVSWKLSPDPLMKNSATSSLCLKAAGRKCNKHQSTLFWSFAFTVNWMRKTSQRSIASSMSQSVKSGRDRSLSSFAFFSLFRFLFSLLPQQMTIELA